MGISQDDALAIAKRGRAVKPRMLVEIGGIDPANIFVPPPPTLAALYCKSCVIQKSNIFGQDRFKAVFALGVGQDYDFWSELRGCSLNLKLKYEGETETGTGNWVQIFRGIADQLDIDCNRGEVTLVGRNLSAYLVDAQAKAKNYNNTSKADVIRNLVAQYDIKVEFGGTEPEGDFGCKVGDLTSHSSMGAQTVCVKEWDIATQIAQETGRTCFVKDDVLHVRNRADNDTFYCLAPSRVYDASGKVCHLGPTNSTSLRFTHNYTLIKYNQVIGIAHNYHTATVNLYTYPPNVSEAAKKNPSSINIVNKDEQDALEKTKAYAEQRAGFEWSMEWTTTGPEILDIEVVDRVIVQGTNSAFDWVYQIYSIEHNINFERGLTTTIIAKAPDTYDAPSVTDE